MNNNSGKGWDDFLLAVKQRFDLDPYEERKATLRQTSAVDVVGVDLSLTLDRHVPTYGMGEETDGTALIYMNATSVRKPHSSTSDLLTLSEAPSPAVLSATTAARANQPANGVGTMILEVDEEILVADNEDNLGCSSSCDGVRNDSIALVVVDPHKASAFDSLILEATTELCSIEAVSLKKCSEATPKDVKSVGKDLFCLSQASCEDDEWRCAILQSGSIILVHHPSFCISEEIFGIDEKRFLEALCRHAHHQTISLRESIGDKQRDHYFDPGGSFAVKFVDKLIDRRQLFGKFLSGLNSDLHFFPAPLELKKLLLKLLSYCQQSVSGLLSTKLTRRFCGRFLVTFPYFPP